MEGAESRSNLQETGSKVTKNVQNALFFGPVAMVTANHNHQDVLHIRFKKSSHPTGLGYLQKAR